MKKVFIIACESSADHHGAELIHHIRQKAPAVDYAGLGGPQMAKAGARLEEDMTRISALGLGDVLRQYGTYRKIFYRALEAAKKWQPDAVVLIDSPAFNLRFAKKLPHYCPGVPVLYYISPQLWAWGGRRIHTVKRTVREMLVILPFEKEMYDKAGISCRFVGHPLLDKIPAPETESKLKARKLLSLNPEKFYIGLLPGSRASEVRRILPILKESAERLQPAFKNAEFLIAKAPGLPDSLYEELLQDASFSKTFFHADFYDHVRAMDFALVASGTATLETTLLGTPFFLIYKASLSTYWMGRMLVKVRYLGLTNLLLDKPAVPEFIQQEARPESIAGQAEKFLKDPESVKKMKEEFKRVRQILGEPGASARAADAVISHLQGVQ